MIALCHDAVTVNEVVNHPEVRPFVGPGGDLDLSAAVAAPENWFLMGEHGGFGLIWSAPGVYEVHTFIKKAGRGVWAKQAAKDGIAFAFDHGAKMLWTKVPEGRENVALYAMAMGMKPAGMSVETFGEPHRIYKMEAQPCQQQQ